MNTFLGIRVLTATCLVLHALGAAAESLPEKGSLDSRIRIAAYSSEEVYRLHGFVGYQIDLQFEAGEVFVGLGAGDIEAVSFVGQDNHLFLKPKAARAATNLTVLTTRRHYQFDYTVSPHQPDPDDADVIYALRFTYPPRSQTGVDAPGGGLESRFDAVATDGPRNTDYWYCGHPSLQPAAASDNGVHTRLRFSAQAELPAIFVLNADGSESLLNFNIESGDVIVHRVASRFIVRRGRLAGCIVNAGYTGSGTRLESGTIAPDVRRETQESSR